jgi:hypothetical protein
VNGQAAIEQVLGDDAARLIAEAIRLVTLCARVTRDTSTIEPSSEDVRKSETVFSCRAELRCMCFSRNGANSSRVLTRSPRDSLRMQP